MERVALCSHNTPIRALPLHMVLKLLAAAGLARDDAELDTAPMLHPLMS
jgi:hypothetical protein